MRHLIVLCLSALTCSACVSFQDKPIVPATVLANYEARTLDAPELRDFIQKNSHGAAPTWPVKSWDLTSLTLAALYYHPDLDIARAKWLVAQTGIVTAGMRPNPNLSVGIQRNRDVTDASSPWTLGWNIDIPLETANKRGYRIDQATHLSDAARFALANTGWQIRSKVRSSLIDLYVAQQIRHQLVEQNSLQLHQYALFKERFQHGFISSSELTQVSIASRQLELSLNDAEKSVADAKAKFADALGVSVRALDQLELASPAQSVPIDDWLTEDLRQQALLNRSDVLSALAEYAASQSALGLEIAKQYPDVSIGPGYSWDAGQRKWSLGLGLTLPVFNQNQGPIAEADARRILAMSNFNAIQAKAVGEIDIAATGYRNTAKQLLVMDKLLDAQNQQMRSVIALYKAGQIDTVTLISAQLEMKQFVIAKWEAWKKAQLALTSMEDAIQKPLIGSDIFPSAIHTNSRQTRELQ